MYRSDAQSKNVLNESVPEPRSRKFSATDKHLSEKQVTTGKLLKASGEAGDLCFALAFFIHNINANPIV